MKKELTFLAAAFSVVFFSAADAARKDADSLDRAIEKGRAFLLSAQNRDGHWSDPHMPALTALPLWALSATEKSPGAPGKAVSNAVAFVLSTQRSDGGFYVPKPGRGGSGLGNYNTSVCLSALFVSGISPTLPMLKARRYIASSQLTGDDTVAGGFGYDKLSRRRYADLSNTSYALDAMRRTEGIEEFRQGERVDVDWNAALKFVDSLVAKSGQDAGGAAYNGDNPQAGTVTNLKNKVHLRSYGSMSYAAVLSMCHARLDRTDFRVRQTLEFCRENWTLDENPRMGSQGLYYYYDILARALSAAKVDRVGNHEWKKELAAKLVSLQRPDGSWYNENNRFWESDKVLCTSFAILSLALCK